MFFLNMRYDECLHNVKSASDIKYITSEEQYGNNVKVCKHCMILSTQPASCEISHSGSYATSQRETYAKFIIC